MDTIVELQQVSRTYVLGPNSIQALKGVNLNIGAGEFTAIAGPSGSGKSTLLNIVGGLDRATSGRVRVAGQETNSMSAAQLSRLRLQHVGFVFQSYNLIPVLTAFENAEYVLMLQGQPPAVRRERAKWALNVVGLEGLDDRFPRELSGGQQQRVAIARALAAQPALVLADEPTANLDSKTAASLLDLMVQLNREKNVTFLFSTHDPAVMSVARRVILMRDGLIEPDPQSPGAPSILESSHEDAPLPRGHAR